MSAFPTSLSGVESGGLRDLCSIGGRRSAEALVPYSTTAPITQSASVAKATTTDTTTSEGVESTEKGTMASDEDYASFLDKANEDPNKGVAKTKTSGKIQLKAVDQGVKIPAALKEATNDAFYVSDADEPFEPVVLKGVKGLPDEGLSFSCFASFLPVEGKRGRSAIGDVAGSW